MRRADDGITMIELIVAARLAGIVGFGMIALEGSRVRMAQRVMRRSGLVTDQGQAALATQQMAERIARADRFVITDSGVQIRYPDGCTGPGPPPLPSCFDNAINYQWNQYTLDGANQLVLFTDTDPSESGCGASTVVARNMTARTFT